MHPKSELDFYKSRGQISSTPLERHFVLRSHEKIHAQQRGFF
jgi:hypothetical protein